MNPSYLTAFGTVAQSTAVLNSRVGSAAANAAGIFAPYPDSSPVGQAAPLCGRPCARIPQYNGIDTYSGGGDHSGHSTYHAGIVRFEKRYSKG